MGVYIWDEQYGLVVELYIEWGKPVSSDDPQNPSTPIEMELESYPCSPEECGWMQGLLLALSMGPLGSLAPAVTVGIRTPSRRGFWLDARG